MNSTISSRYRRLSQQLSAAVDDLPTEAWNAPTPCEGWTVRDVLQHIVDTQRDFLGRHVDLEPATGEVRRDWENVRTLAQSVLADERGATSFEGFFGPTTIAEVVDRFYGMDLLVHRWDIARGAGTTAHQRLDDTDAAHYLEAARSHGDTLRMDGICGPEVPAPVDATTGERLLAFLGRDPRS
ncbi:TIGR03086 family metal-binding protein [Brevibacterium yomogidense]|uniref:TIGR03086 family metal-binding protein n=1 Tax=Brevibacterium yomogidense TaxID=946573 RepID=UPI0018DF3425|nr:TIGR03086 family metal-binding protein [Brevibacterium yomogidense]